MKWITRGNTIVDLFGNREAQLVTRDFMVPRVFAYRERCMARPAWKKRIESYCERVKAG